MVPQDLDTSPEDAAGFLSRLTFAWVIPFMRRSLREIHGQSFGQSSLPQVSRDESCEGAVETLRAKLAEQSGTSKPSLHGALYQIWRGLFWKEIIRAGLCGVLFMVSPLLLRSLVEALQRGLYLEACGAVAAIALCGLLAGVQQQIQFHNFTFFGRQIWASLVGNMFDKLARLDSADFNDKFSEGQVLSMIGQDTTLFPYMSPFFGIFMVCPWNIVLPATVLLVYLREAFLAGLAVSLLFLFLSNRAAVAYKRVMMMKLKVADSRLVVVNEALQGIRSVKLCAWEAALEARVEEVREAELRLIRQLHICYACQQGLTSVLPVLGCVCMFLVHVALGRALDAGTVAMAIAYFDQMALGFLLLPNGKMQLETMSAGILRIQRLLLEPEGFEPRKAAAKDEDLGIAIMNASFLWRSAKPDDDSTLKPALSGVSVSVRPGQLVVVVGPVASGKSTLAAGVFGMTKLTPASGGVRLVGQAAYVPQNPQVLNATVRENILFGLDMEEERYLDALRACCLEPDIEQFSEGDDTEIGEKGITVSGGQRARIALARAYYADADVVVLDDPLSAMDAHVGAKVFQSCVLRMRSEGKAVLLTTNFLQLCSSANHILMLDAGAVVAQGPFLELAEQLGLDSSIAAAGDAAVETKPVQSNPKAASEHTDGFRKSDLMPAKRKSGMKIETVLQGRVGWSEWQHIARGSRSKAVSYLLISLCLLVPVFMYSTSMLLGVWTSRAAESEGAEAALPEMLLYISSGVLFSLSCAARVSASATYFLRISRQLHRRMLSSVLRQPLAWYDTTPLGRVLNRFSQDVSLMDVQLPRLFEFAIMHFTYVIVGVVGAGAIAWPVLLVIIPLAWPLSRLQNAYNTVALNLQRLMLNATSPVMSQAAGFLTALDTIRAFGRERHFAADFRRAMQRYNEAYYWIHATDRLAMSSLTVLCIPLLTLLLGCAVLPLTWYEMLSPELGVMAFAISCGLAQRIPLYLWCAGTVEKFFGGAQRVAEYADLPWEGNSVDHAAWLGFASSTRQFEDVTKSVGQAPALKLENVHLRYQPDLPLVLQGLDLEVQDGERLGVCGRTGSGKSTLFLACFRMIEIETGQIYLGGKDAKLLPLPHLRSQLAIVPQDPLMFSGTLRSNLDFYGRHKEDELWEALRLARLEEQVKALPLGLEEPVQEKGTNFSGGTVQLLCIARVLLAQQRVLFLDECTASVDLQTDAKVQAAIRSACQSCAVICIAHRLHTIIDYDRIAFLDAGKVAETGSPGELLLRKGAFSKLVTSLGDTGANEICQMVMAAARARGDAETADALSTKVFM